MLNKTKSFRNSSNSSVEKLGNTKQISPSKHWCFTFNNHTAEDIKMFLNTDKNIVPKFVFQEECGESGTPHLQGYLMFKTKKRPMSVFKGNKIHWEKTKNITASIDYCQKADTRNGEVYYRGIDPPFNIELPKIYEWEQYIIDILDKSPSDRDIHWLWEHKGCVGKTTFAKWIFTHYDDVVVMGGKATDMKNGIINYKNTCNKLPKIILCDIPRSSMNYISYTGLEEIKNMFFFSGKYEGGMVCGKPPHLIVFANEGPDYEQMSKDRWIVKEL